MSTQYPNETPGSKQLEKQLCTVQRRFESILEAASAAIISIDDNQNIILFNRVAERTFGYTADEVMGKPLSILMPSQFHANHAKMVTGFGGESIAWRLMSERDETELFGIRRNGEVFPIEVAISKLHLEDGLIFTAILNDITRRKQNEAALQESEARLAQAQRVAHIGHWDWNIATGVLRWSDEIYRIFGLEPQEFAATYTAFLERVHPDDRAAVQAAVDQALLGAPYRIEHRIVMPDGEERFVHEQGEVTFDDNSMPIRMIGTVQDITELKRYQNALAEHIEELQGLYDKVRHLEQLKTDMIRIAAHDLRNPLAIIIGNIDLMQMYLDDGQWTVGELNEFLDNIRRGAQRMSDLTEDILSLERIEQAAENMSFNNVDLAVLVRTSYETLKNATPLESRHLTLVLPDMAFIVNGDAIQLREAIDNLIENAIKYTRADGYIRVHLERREDEVVFEVEDNGFGIPTEKQQNLFQPFYRARTTDTLEIQGTGLGLHLVKNIVERHYGTVSVKSVHGVGSTFGFALPVARAESQ